MLTISSPIEIKAKTAYINDPEAFYQRIVGNYSLIETRIDEEDLLHIATTPPEIYVTEGEGMSSLLVQNQRNENNIQKVNIINNVLNRIVASANVELSYQDRVFISDALYKLGIKDDRKFMNAFYKMAEETNNVSSLISLYFEKGEGIKELMSELEIRSRRDTITENSEIIRERENVLYSRVMDRLHTGEIYQIVSNYNRTTEENEIDAREYSISNQTYTAQHMLLSLLRESAGVADTDEIYLDNSLYEENIDTENNTDINVKNDITRALLFDMLKNLYHTGIDKFINKNDIYYNFTDTFYGSSNETFLRLVNNSIIHKFSPEERYYSGYENNFLNRTEISLLQKMGTDDDYETELIELTKVLSDLNVNNAKKYENYNFFLENRTENRLANMFLQSPDKLTREKIDLLLPYESEEYSGIDNEKANNTTINNQFDINTNEYSILLDRLTSRLHDRVIEKEMNQKAKEISDRQQADLLVFLESKGVIINDQVVDKTSELINYINNQYSSEEKLANNTTKVKEFLNTFSSIQSDNFTEYEKEIEKIIERNDATLINNIGKLSEDFKEPEIIAEEKNELSDEDVKKITESVNAINIQNEQRRIEYIKTLETLQKREQAQSVGNGLKQTRKDAILALNNPEKLKEELAERQENRNRKQAQIIQQMQQIFPNQTAEIYQLINEYYGGNFDLIQNNIMRPAETGELLYDINEAERMSSSFENKKSQEERETAEFLQRIKEEKNSQRQRRKTESFNVPVETVHRTTETLTTEELNDQISQLQNSISRQINKEIRTEQITENNIINQNVTTSNETIKKQISSYDIEKMIENGVKQQMNTISNQVIGKLERQMRNEKARRGYT
ncbi:MAG: hypothetical protein IJR29_09810 [Butyrivibrio sp.]|nr:hypothetical protein [Butyrivibrio sp.]